LDIEDLFKYEVALFKDWGLLILGSVSKLYWRGVWLGVEEWSRVD